MRVEVEFEIVVKVMIVEEVFLKEIGLFCFRYFIYLEMIWSIWIVLGLKCFDYFGMFFFVG